MNPLPPAPAIGSDSVSPATAPSGGRTAATPSQDNILCLGTGWFPTRAGGLERYVYELILHLAEHNWLELCGLDLPPAADCDRLTLNSLASVDQSMGRRLWQIYRHFRQRDLSSFNAINLHFAIYSWPLLAALPADVPVTFTFHGPWAMESAQEGAGRLSVGVKHALEQQVYRRCDRFITLSKAFGDILHQQFGVPWDRITVIPGGVDTRRFDLTLSRQQARQQLGWPQDRFVMFTPRRLVQRMGLGQLLTALAPLAARGEEVWLAIAGKGPLRDTLATQVQELGLEDHVKFLGFLPDADLPIAYQAADLTVMPSQSLEGFGLVLLESLACGTPVLCTPVGGMPEVIQTFSPDLITADPTAQSLQDVFVRILAGKLALPSRAACRSYAATTFDWPTIAARVQRVLLQG